MPEKAVASSKKLSVGRPKKTPPEKLAKMALKAMRLENLRKARVAKALANAISNAIIK